MHFDFVIIGAGSAGCALANRLSANGRHSVALLEAGGKDTNPWIHIPVGYFKTMGNPKTDWQYTCKTDPNMGGRAMPWPRGRVLGGSSSINGLLYVRGQPDDYNDWRDLGNDGWGWADVAPYFKRSETWHGTPHELRGTDGPLQVSPTRLRRTIVDNWVKAGQAAGYPFNPDYNGDSQTGVGYFQLTMDKGRRCSSARAYLRGIKSRKNLTILTHTIAEKLVIVGKRTTAVRAIQNGKPITINVGREAILCAGAIGSPQIMMLSGIGEADALARHKIRLVADLAGVGKNLQDHLQARPIFKTKLPTINTEVSNIFKQAMIALQYAVNRTGPMAMAASLGTAFLSTDGSARPDIQFHIQPFSANNAIEGTHRFSAFTASVLQLRPHSTGQITLASARIEDHPIIEPNYLSSPIDQDIIVKGIQIARKIATFEPLRGVITEEYEPGAGIADSDTAGLLDWARRTAVTIYHPTGTCKMGHASDKTAVVDSQLRVHGIKGLRIADCSVMPIIPSGNTNAPAIMVGEKAADMILHSI